MSAVLSFVAPPPGFAPHTRFALAPVEGADGLFHLDAIDDDALRLYVVDPQTVVADYAPTLSAAHVDELGLSTPEDALLLVVVGRGPEGVHVNLLAPIVANRSTGIAAQLILEDQDLPLRAVLA